MSTIDIRTPSSYPSFIVFAEANDSDESQQANRIDLYGGNQDFIYIEEANGQGDIVRVNRKDIPNLIKALQKANELVGPK